VCILNSLPTRTARAIGAHEAAAPQAPSEHASNNERTAAVVRTSLLAFKMVVIHVKRTEADQFLYETTLATPNDTVIRELVSGKAAARRRARAYSQ
jgi:hypothetical protein